MRLRVEVRRSARRCALCHGGLDDPIATCAGCGTVSHLDCLSDARRCSTLGCVEAPRRRGIAPRADVVLAAAIGAVFGLLAFAVGVGLGWPERAPRWGLIAFFALGFAFIGGWSGAGGHALEQRAARRAGLLDHWPYAVPLVVALFLAGLGALVADSLAEPAPGGGPFVYTIY